MNLIIIGSGNGLTPGRRQAITWTNADLLFTGPLVTVLIKKIIIEGKAF